ncbi:MAG: hypothetical protein Greene101449_82 [Candidatus Peregrinibacteria bacterium Greene1014_49]|nr:MAG: hypothetical protein Greene101449_82 [Candidatus Peregrinibacteria bacterium Greene1014_49]
MPSLLRNATPLGSLTLGIALAITLDQFLPVRVVIDYPFTTLGVLPIVAGVLQFSWCVSLFTNAKTELAPGGMPTTLVTSGPYRYTRNPIYLANMLVLLGTCVMLGSLSPFIVIPLFFLVVNTFIIPFEERRLHSIFGEDYAAFQRRVRRWL